MGLWRRDQTFRKPSVLFIMAAKKHAGENYLGSFVLYKGCVRACGHTRVF